MNHKISKSEHQNIIDLYKDNKSTKSLAKQYNVTNVSIRNILHEHNIELRTCWWESKKYKPIKHYFDKIDDENKAYFLGLLWADGCNNGRGVMISLQEGDESVLQTMSKNIFSNERPLTFIDKSKYDEKNAYRLTIYDVEILRVLQSFGLVEAKSLILKYPKEGVIPKDLFRHFLRGYFDGDGWASLMHRYNKWHVIVLEWGIIGTKSFMTSMKQKIEEALKIKINKITKHSSVFRIRITKKQILEKLYRFLYSYSTIYLPRKKEKFEQYFQISA